MSGAETPASPSHGKVLSASYIEKNSGIKDLVKRLRKISHILEEDQNVEPDSSDYPGLASMATCLAQKYVGHSDKEVRLFAVLVCMELFLVYAPEAPWANAETCEIFRQTIRQLANLSHCTGPKDNHFKQYKRILHLLAEVKIGVVLVDIAKNDGNRMPEDDDDTGDNPMELLAELFHTTLQSLRPQHPEIITKYVKEMIIACLEEYFGGVSVPLPLLEEILICIGQGPTLFYLETKVPAPVEDDGKKKKGKGGKKTPPPPLQVEKPNPSYAVARKIIQKHMHGLSTSIANLLNGIINGEPRIVQRSSIVAGDDEEEDNDNVSAADVWNIIFQVGKISPPILTTVIGTVTNCLASEDSKRQKATHLLGKLFRAKGSNLATKFGPCFRQWLNRFCDVEEETRLFMVTSLLQIVQSNKDPNVRHVAERHLIAMMSHDKSKNVRLMAVDEVFDYAYHHNDSSNEEEETTDENHMNPISSNLLKAVGERVRSKLPAERLKALTGMGQVYFKDYIRRTLQPIEAAGNDCDVKLLSKVLTENCSRSSIFAKDDDSNEQSQKENKYEFMGRLIFKCLFFNEGNDTDMWRRIITIIDDLLLGSENSKNSKKKVSPKARVVGLAIVLDSLRDPGEDAFDEHSTSNSFKYMTGFFKRRLGLQKALGAYIDARSFIKKHPQGSQEAEEANDVAMQKLKMVASFLPKAPDGLLESFHAARDRRIFQTLALLSNPGHTRATRNRAMEELPKRTQSLGDGVAGWVEDLVRRCSMGSFLNADVVEDSIRWANECLSRGDVPCAAALLANAHVVVGIFPSICAQTESFEALKSMFSTCLSSSSSAAAKKVKRQAVECGLLTSITWLLSRVARASLDAPDADKERDADDHLDTVIRKKLLQLCTKEGTPQQARNAVATLATLFTAPKNSIDEPIDGQACAWLMKELTLPSKMSVICEDEEGSKESGQIVSILSALSAVVERAPVPFSRSAKGDSAVKFALEKVLLGRGSSREAVSDSEASEDEDETPKKKKSRKKKNGVQHRSPLGKKSPLENSDLSLACRRLCAAIEFLVAYVRSTILASNSEMISVEAVSGPSDDRLRALFDVLSQLIRDKGVPPSKRDRLLCRSRQDRAAIRQCAAVHFLRLCSSRLKLERKYLSTKMWHILGGAVLDEEQVVREAVMEELSNMIGGLGAFSNDLPQLRFVALTVLCVDGPARSQTANGNAANVGNVRTLAAKAAAVRCFKTLRLLGTNIQEELEEGDESLEELKTQYMPENVVPYAFHLLAFRRETPDKENKEEKTKDSFHGILNKRLKMLFEPLFESLGDNPDNISFLLSMTNWLSEYAPIDIAPDRLSLPSGGQDGSPSSLGSAISKEAKSPKESAAKVALSPETKAKLYAVCAAAKAVLMDNVKKSENLPSDIFKVRIPPSLFRKANRKPKNSTPKSASKRAKVDDDEEVNGDRGSKKRGLPEEVDFLPDGEAGAALESLGVSPIAKAGSPGSSTPAPRQKSPSLSEEEKTLSPGMTEGETPTSVRAPKRTQEDEEEKTLSPGTTKGESPISACAPKRTQESEVTRVCTQSVDATPNKRAKTATGESPRTLGFQTQEEETQKRRGAKKKAKIVPSQIHVGDLKDKSPFLVRRKSTRKRSSPGSSSVEEEKVKPLRDSNRAPKRAKKRNKRSPAPESELLRRSPLSRSTIM